MYVLVFDSIFMRMLRRDLVFVRTYFFFSSVSLTRCLIVELHYCLVTINSGWVVILLLFIVVAVT